LNLHCCCVDFDGVAVVIVVAAGTGVVPSVLFWYWFGVDFVLDCSFVEMIDDHDYDRIQIGTSSANIADDGMTTITLFSHYL
jgi:hypothetical protein